jgi:hypothetical protein
MRSIMGCTLLLAALLSAACHTMKPVSLEQLTALKPDRAWVTDADQSVVVVSRPQVVGDTLVGYVKGTYEQLPSAGLKQVIVQRSAPTRTALLATGIALGLGVAFFVTRSSEPRVDHAYARVCPGHPVTPDDCNY